MPEPNEVRAEFDDELDHYMLDWEKSLREHLAIAEETANGAESGVEGDDAGLGEQTNI